MAGIANAFGKLDPLALMAAGSAMLAPGPTSGARIASGFQGLLQGMQLAQQRQESALKLKAFSDQIEQQQRQRDALLRFTDPTGAAYSPTMNLTTPGLANAQGIEVPQLASEMTTNPSQFSRMSDLITLAPQEYAKAQMQSMFDPTANLPDEIRTLMIYKDNPDLAKLHAALDPTGPAAQLQAAGIEPGSPEALSFLMNKGRSNINVNTAENQIDRAWGTKDAEIQGDLLKQYNEAAKSGQDMQFLLDRYSDSMTQYKETGFGGNTRLLLGQMANWLGADVSGLGEGEVMQAIQNRLTPMMRNGLPGNASDRDVSMFMGALPNMIRTEGGNARIMQIFQRINDRNNAASDIANRLFRERKLTPGNVQRELDKKGLGTVLTNEDRVALTTGNLSGKPLTKEGFGSMNAKDIMMIDPSKLTPQQQQWLNDRARELGG